MEQSAKTIPAGQARKNDWLAPILIFIVSVALGVCFIIWHKNASVYLAIALSAAVAVLGIVELITFLKKKEALRPFTIGRLSIAMTLIAIGIFLCFFPQIIEKIMPFIIACAIIFTGFITLQTAIDLIRLKVGKWFIPLIFAIVMIGCGFLGLIPTIWTKQESLMLFLGIVLCVEGVMELVSYFLFCYKEKHE